MFPIPWSRGISVAMDHCGSDLYIAPQTAIRAAVALASLLSSLMI